MTSRRDEVLEAALALLDDVGLDAITVRKLAERLGVQPGALYRHFASKRELLDAMVARIVGPVPELELSGPWPDLVRTIAGSARSAMLAHRDGARLLSTFNTPSEAAILAWQRFVGLFIGLGMSDHAAYVAVDTVFCYVNGFTTEEQARGGRPREERDEAFRAGLELIIAGIEATLPAGPPDGPTRGPVSDHAAS